MNNASTTVPDEVLLVPVAAAATRLGHKDQYHFRRICAEKFGLSPFRRGNRWFVTAAQLGEVTAELLKPSSTGVTSR